MAYAAFVNADLVTQARGAIVRTGATGQCLLAQADTLAHVANLLGTRLADVLTTASGQIGAFDEPGQLIRMDAAPAVGAVVYVSAATPGVGTTTKPAIAVPVGTCYEATNVAGVDYAAVTPIVPGSTPGTLSGGTLASSYLAGASAADQTISLADANGGGVVVDASGGGFTGTNALSVLGADGGHIYFPRVGGASLLLDRTLTVPVAGSTWNGLYVQASTLTLAAGGTAPSALSLCYIDAPTISGAYVIPVASTLTIAGPPIAAGGATITNPLALNVLSGSTFLAAPVFVGLQTSQTNDLTVANSLAGGPFITSYSPRADAIATVHVLAGTIGGFFRAYAPGFGIAGLANGAAFGPDVGTTKIIVFSNPTTSDGGLGSISLRGGGFDTPAEKLLIDKNGVKFGGGITIHTTDVNAAGPYVVLDNDYLIHVRYTATGTISIDLPALTGGIQLDGRTVIVVDSGDNAAAFNITLVLGNAADKINFVNANYVINANGAAVTLVANTTTNNWEIT